MSAGERVFGLPPVCDGRGRILLLGTFPSPLSRERGMYYGNPRNSFWTLLCAALGAPLPNTPDEARALLLSRGLALWDVVRSCVVSGAADSSIREAEANDIPALLAARPGITRVLFTSANARRLYARLIAPPGPPPDWDTLPSPSPAYAAMPLAEKLGLWVEKLG